MGKRIALINVTQDIINEISARKSLPKIKRPQIVVWRAIYEATNIRTGVRAGYLINTDPRVVYGRAPKYVLPDSVVAFYKRPEKMEPFSFWLEEIE